MQCLTKISTKNGLVPCGKCPICKLNYLRFWFSRLICEAEHSPLSVFITLTFSDDFYPEDTSKDNQTRIFQDFLKRLRYYLPYKFRYFAVSEFGDLHDRLHFHALLCFKPGYDPVDISVSLDSAFSQAWSFGFVDVKTCNPQVIYYMLKYELKNFGKHDTIRLISKGISSQVCDDMDKLDFLNYDGITLRNTSLRYNKYIYNRVIPHDLQDLVDGKVPYRNRMIWEEVKRRITSDDSSLFKAIDLLFSNWRLESGSPLDYYLVPKNTSAIKSDVHFPYAICNNGEYALPKSYWLKKIYASLKLYKKSTL